jgi:photosystem II stability/assembly factor-like uncharacterized protein
MLTVILNKLPKMGRNLFAILGLLLLMAVRAPVHAEPEYYALTHDAITIKSPTTTPLVAITRVDQRLFAVGLHGVIIASDDSGVSWKQMPVPVDLTLTAIYFKSKSEGWVVGHYGVVLHTTDGGLTWTKSLDGLNVVEALNATAAQAVGNPISDSDTAMKQRVATAFHAAGPSKPFLAIGRCGNGILAAGQQDMAMFNSNGKQWQEWTSKITNPQFRNIYAIVDEGDETFLIGEGGLILKSEADCLNFKPLPGPFSATLFGGVMASQGNLLVYGLIGDIYKSTDDGETWSTVPPPTDSLFSSGLLLNSGEAVLGALEGGLYVNDQGFHNFLQLPINIPFEIAGMVLAPDGHLVVVGSGGVRIVTLLSQH